MLTVWEDINIEVEALPITPITYDPGSLTNKLYDIIDNKTELRKTLIGNKVTGLYKDVPIIQDHCKVINNDERVNNIIKEIFKDSKDLTSLDRVFVNAYYRRLMRAHLEKDYLTKDLPIGKSISGVKEIDKCLIDALRLFRIICKFLNIPSTITSASFPKSKLTNISFWSSISEKLMMLFGETRIRLIEMIEDQYLEQGLSSSESQSEEIQIFVLLNIAFNGWSGSILSITGDNVEVIPATYITRMITKLL